MFDVCCAVQYTPVQEVLADPKVLWGGLGGNRGVIPVLEYESVFSYIEQFISDLSVISLKEE